MVTSAYVCRTPDTILLTATSSFDSLNAENLALLDLNGRLLEGEISPTNAEIVHMYAVVYKQRPETSAVVHTHSTYATLVRADMTDGVPLAHYGPRGSAASVDNIAAALSSAANTKAVLLENHGVLVFGRHQYDGRLARPCAWFSKNSKCRSRFVRPLALPARKIHTRVEQCCLVLVRQCFYKIVGAAQARRLADVFVCRRRATISNVFGYRRR
jgi:hypothetical protein